QGKTQLAIDHYQWVLRDDPEDIDARFNLARTYQRAGDPEQARAEFRKILELAPEDIQALRALEELSSSN
ncbi:MAG TPA: tetratricopeptide repeat protein, partial [Myxococcales bacterium]|nr:tetratricopeptide repeat protein [Myxococcales bacterium]